jgi:protein-S-isoprenylcysteine O-methyltransferase Ste14
MQAPGSLGHAIGDPARQAEEKPPRRPSPLHYFLAALVLSGAAGVAGGLLGGVGGALFAGAIPLPWNLAGALLVIAGVAIAFAGEAQFNRAGTSVKPFARAAVLVTDGLFRFSRNPMYLGMLAVLAGVAVLEGSIVALAVALLFAWRVQRTFILPEEWRLESQFQNEYRLYRRRVRRWI